MNTEHEVRERRLVAVLEEVAGDGVPAGLADRVLARVRAEPAVRAPRRGAMLLAALLMLGGIGVVVATAQLRSVAAPAASQDPAPRQGEVPSVTITTATVRDACKPIDAAPPPGDGVARLLALVKGEPFGIVVAPGVHGESKVDLVGLTWHEAVAHVAAELGAGVADFGTMVVVGIGPVVPVERLRCTLRVKDLGVRDLGEVLHASTGINLVVAGDLAGRVTLDIDTVPVRALLDVVAQQLSLDVVGCGSALALRRATARREPPGLSMYAPRLLFAEVLDRLAHVAKLNMVVAPGIAGVVSVRAESPDRDELLTALCAAFGADVWREDRAITRVAPRLALPVAVSLEDVSASGVASIKLRDVKIETGPPGTSTTRIQTADAVSLDMLRAAAAATGRTFVRTDDGYALR